MRLAQIENGVVVNVIEVDSLNRGGFTVGYAEAGAAGPGWLVSGGTLVPPPPPAPDPEQALAEMRANMPPLSFVQTLTGLVTEGFITEAEGDGWLTGTLPTAVVGLVNTLPANQRFAARARATAFSQALRTDPLLLGLADARNPKVTPAELDAFFIKYRVK